MNNLKRKFLSWKRWSWIGATVAPTVLQVFQGGLSASELIGYTVGALLVGMGVIGAEDITRLKVRAEDADWED